MKPMIRGKSIQRRLAVGLAVFVLFLWLVATVASGFVVRHELDEAFDSSLQESAQRLLSLAVVDIMDHDDNGMPRTVSALGHHEEYLTYIVRDAKGKILLQSHDSRPSVFPQKPVIGFVTREDHRIYGQSAVSGTIFIEVAEPLDHRREAAMEATVGLLIPLPFLVPLSLLGVWFFIRRAMRPMISLNEQIEARHSADLSDVDIGEAPSELQSTLDALNGLLLRLRQAIDSERSFAANSAHELRTPIAGALAQTQLLIEKTDNRDVRERARKVEEGLHRLARISEKLMQLARAEAGVFVTDTPQDLVPVIEYVVDDFRHDKAVADRIRWAGREAPDLTVRMDRDGFAILLRNLIENALKHSPEGSPVDIHLDVQGRLHVVNEGPTVPPDVLEKLKGRFERGKSTAAGAGLGLAIVEAIVAGVGARLDLLSPADGHAGGFEAVVDFTPLH